MTSLKVKYSRDERPVLNSPLKNTKKLSNSSPPEFPEEVFMQLVNMAKEILLDISISPQGKWSFIPTCTLLDSGANVIFIDKAWAEEKKLPLWPLHHAILVFNIDSTKNSTSNIIHCADITISYQGHWEKVTAKVIDLRKNQMILGFTWLQKHNPEIDWEHSVEHTIQHKGLLTCQWGVSGRNSLVLWLMVVVIKQASIRTQMLSLNVIYDYNIPIMTIYSYTAIYYVL